MEYTKRIVSDPDIMLADESVDFRGAFPIFCKPGSQKMVEELWQRSQNETAGWIPLR